MAFGRVERVMGFKVSGKVGPRERVAIGGLISNAGRPGTGVKALRKSESCTLVPFHKRNGAVVVVQRCDDKKLSTAAKARVRRYGLPRGFKRRR